MSTILILGITAVCTIGGQCVTFLASGFQSSQSVMGDYFSFLAAVLALT